MKLIRINGNWTLADYESAISDPDIGKKTVLIPNKIRESGALGRSLQLAQFLLTWSRKNNHPIIHSYLADDDKDSIESFSKKTHSLAAAYFADLVISEKGKGRDIRYDILKSASPRIKAMSTGDLDSLRYGTKFDFIFVEGAKSEFHGAFYQRTPTLLEKEDGELHKKCVRSVKECNQMLRLWFKKLTIPKTIIERLVQPLTSQGEDTSIGRALIEAFENSCEHAYRDPSGSSYKRNMRCITVSKVQSIWKKTLEEFETSAIGSQIISKEYFSSLSEKLSSRTRDDGKTRQTLSFLEISIFDSGSGFSATMQKALGNENTNNLTIDIERVIKCFKKSGTSKQHNTVAGKGLYRILHSVYELRGFLRVRTSTAEAFFATVPRLSPDSDPAKYVHGGLTQVEGTLITIGIPL